jgi:protein subunit release factor A
MRRLWLFSAFSVFCAFSSPAVAQNDDKIDSLPAVCECQTVTRPHWFISHNARISKTEKKCAEFEQQIDQVKKDTQSLLDEGLRKQFNELVEKIDSKLNTLKTAEVNRTIVPLHYLDIHIYILEYRWTVVVCRI